MLRRGPYPASLKLRILSDEGHLSNNACATELPTLLKNGTTRIILGHISRENNTPLLALSAARATLGGIGAKDGVDYILETAKPKTVGVTVF
jgi:phosphoribosyl 1,2-cyclic phosphodiesterase